MALFRSSALAALAAAAITLSFHAALAANFDLTVSKAGSGTGAITSDVGGINCGNTCSASYAAGSAVILTATPSGGSQFTGWLGACTGMGACQVTMNTARSATATFANPPVATAWLDVDGSGATDALTDGLLVMRYLFGLSGAPLTAGAIANGAVRLTPTQVTGYLVDAKPVLDIDGNGGTDALTDGLLVLRYLFGLRGDALIAGAVATGATRTTSSAIESALATLVAPPANSFPSNPIPANGYSKNTPFTLNDGTTVNYVDVPDAYDTTHHTPIKLLVWLHGCGGFASGDIYDVSPGGSQSWISVAIGGEEGNCWNMTTDVTRVMNAVAYMNTRFNIDPRQVVIGGYSSGGDLAYRTIFYNSRTFAGCLIENSSPFRDTGSSQAQSFAAVSNGGWKFNCVHLAHLQDTTYPISGVRTETSAMINAGYPLSRLEVDGGHYDDPGAIENGHAVPGTVADLVSILLPHMNEGWMSP